MCILFSEEEKVSGICLVNQTRFSLLFAWVTSTRDNKWLHDVNKTKAAVASDLPRGLLDRQHKPLHRLHRPNGQPISVRRSARTQDSPSVSYRDSLRHSVMRDTCTPVRQLVRGDVAGLRAGVGFLGWMDASGQAPA